jgi:hypothetical protein
MHHGKLMGADIRKYSENRVFAGSLIEMDAVAGDPDEDLRFGLHGRNECWEAKAGMSKRGIAKIVEP